MREEKSAKNRTISSKKYWKMNPGEIDDSTVEALVGFKQAKDTREDPAYKKILSKCSKASHETFSGNTNSILVPKPNTTHEDFKEWSRGKAGEVK